MHECEIVEELLPLEAENMLGEVTSQFVAEHLKQCPKCQQLYTHLPTGSCDRLSTAPAPEAQLPERELERERVVSKIVRGYKRWFYSILLIAITFSLLGGITGTYFTMKYEELMPMHIAQEFVKYGLKGDRWVYQERTALALQQQLPFERYLDLRTWEQMEQASKQADPSGVKVYKQLTAQEFGPIDVQLEVGLVLEQGGFRVFRVKVNNKEDYLRRKKALEQAVEQHQGSDRITELDPQYLEVEPANPAQGEYFVEGKILRIQGDEIFFEQHLDTHSVPKTSLKVNQKTLLVRHQVIKETDYFRKIAFAEIKVGDNFFVIFTKSNEPRVVALTN